MWTDFRILEHQNKTSYYKPGNETPVDYLSREELKLKRKTNNNPVVLNSTWKPNLFIGKYYSENKNKLTILHTRFNPFL